MRDEQPVDSATRTFGWIITILSGFGIYTMVQYIESLDFNNFINTIIAVPIFWGCFMGQFILIEKFDLFADRKKQMTNGGYNVGQFIYLLGQV